MNGREEVVVNTRGRRWNNNSGEIFNDFFSFFYWILFGWLVRRLEKKKVMGEKKILKKKQKSRKFLKKVKNRNTQVFFLNLCNRTKHGKIYANFYLVGYLLWI
jgi:hypothetical protein